ncbi:SymE family type I addiction module toxin [Proteus cibi]
MYSHLILSFIVSKNRQYTVGDLPNRDKPNPSPQLIISSKWLEELGF